MLQILHKALFGIYVQSNIVLIYLLQFAPEYFKKIVFLLLYHKRVMGRYLFL